MQNPPSLAALKLMHILIARAGPRMAEDVRHEIRLSEIRAIAGLRHHDRASLDPLFAELRGAVLTHDDPQMKVKKIGGFLDTAAVDYREAGGDLIVSWFFSRFFTEAAAKSEHWAILDRQVAMGLRSRYSMLLFQHVSSLVNLSHVTSRTFSLPELRGILGVQPEKLKRFADLNSDALKPAIDEISAESRFVLSVQLHKTGRSVTGVEIGWTPKPDPIRRPPRLVAASAAPAAQVSSAPAFPSCGGIGYSPHWQDIKRAAGCNKDDQLIASDFRRFCQGRNIALDSKGIAKVFKDYCAKVGKV